MADTYLKQYNFMKHLLYVTLLVSVFTACQHRPQKAVQEVPSLFGTWHYELMTWSPVDDTANTTQKTSLNDTLQNYDVFKEDSTLISYTFRNDSVISKRVYKFEVRNDSIYVKNDSFSTFTQILELTDSTLWMGYTEMENDTVWVMKTLSRKCQLPQISK